MMNTVTSTISVSLGSHGNACGETLTIAETMT
ncbi:hypothetical protein HY17_19270 [Hyphomonas sp. CY54-11-8]|nr:hypothetical protein HY17_19270 [Hyphomonas sp. CY54-11-8]